MVKDILIIADLGAAGNLVRNLLLLSAQVDWPLPTDRYASILSQYQNLTDMSQWLDIEHKLRFWKNYYEVDMSDHLDFQIFQQRKRMSSPVVYLNHSAFYQPVELEQFKNEVDILYIAPITKFGLDWQVRSYCEKKTVEKLHNFTFESDMEQQKYQFCKEHGHDAYYRLNITNFKEILKSRQKEFGTPDLPLEMLLSESIIPILEIISQRVGVSIDTQQAEQVLAHWRQCHWLLSDTNNWKYHDHNAKH